MTNETEPVAAASFDFANAKYLRSSKQVRESAGPGGWPAGSSLDGTLSEAEERLKAGLEVGDGLKWLLSRREVDGETPGAHRPMRLLTSREVAERAERRRPETQSLGDVRRKQKESAKRHPDARPLPDNVRYNPEPIRRVYSSNPQELAEELVDLMVEAGSEKYISVSITEVSEGEFCLAVWAPIFGDWSDEASA